MEDDSCMGCVHARMSFSEDQELPVWKCYRYPPQVKLDQNGEWSQMYPDAWLRCGEFYPAEKTQRVIGTLRKVKDYATRISASAIGHLRSVRRSRGDSQHSDSPDSTQAHDAP